MRPGPHNEHVVIVAFTGSVSPHGLRGHREDQPRDMISRALDSGSHIDAKFSDGDPRRRPRSVLMKLSRPGRQAPEQRGMVFEPVGEHVHHRAFALHLSNDPEQA